MSAFWDGFWSVFRHPFVIYILGVTAGFWIGAAVVAWTVKC